MCTLIHLHVMGTCTFFSSSSSFLIPIFYRLVGCLSRIVWTPAVLGVSHACVLYFCMCTCSPQLIMFHVESRSRNTFIITIIIKREKKKRERDRERERQRKRDRQTDRLTERQTDRPREREREREGQWVEKGNRQTVGETESDGKTGCRHCTHLSDSPTTQSHELNILFVTAAVFAAVFLRQQPAVIPFRTVVHFNML